MESQSKFFRGMRCSCRHVPNSTMLPRLFSINEVADSFEKTSRRPRQYCQLGHSNYSSQTKFSFIMSSALEHNSNKQYNMTKLSFSFRTKTRLQLVIVSRDCCKYLMK